MNQPTVAAQNALSGEKTFSTVSFAVTGDVETDLISAVVACVNTMQSAGTYESSFAIAARVLAYLATRYHDGVAAKAEYMKQFQPAIQATPTCPPVAHYTTGAMGISPFANVSIQQIEGENQVILWHTNLPVPHWQRLAQPNPYLCSALRMCRPLMQSCTGYC